MTRPKAEKSDVYDPKRGVIAYFKTRGGVSGSTPAILTQAGAVSYAHLSKDVRKVAATLWDRGVRKGDFVGILAGRGVEAIVAMLACARIGAVFAPLDPSHARERLPFIVNDLGVKTVLTSARYHDEAEALLGGPFDLTAIADVMKGPKAKGLDYAYPAGEDAFCVLYTSGTTGNPKGVLVPNRAVTSMVFGHPELWFEPSDRALCSATFACDGALLELWGPLLSGAAAAVVEVAKPSLEDIAHVMRRDQVTVTSFYAGMLNLMIDRQLDAFATVRAVETGGDVMSLPHAAKLLERFPDIALYNDYGPTETCNFSMSHRVTAADIASGVISIGRGAVYEEPFLTETGELAIAGDGVALGYHNRAEETAKRFVADPREGRTGLVYLTGDLAEIDAQGVFWFKGRADRQVKLAGHRVELDEVEHVLRACDGVEDAFVALRDATSGAKQMVGFYTGTASAATVIDSAAKILPRETLPKRLEWVEAFTLTGAGKVNRAAMLAGLADAPRASVSTAASENAVQHAIAQAWQTVLGVAAGPEDRFFDLGGSSLQLIDAHALIEKALGRTLDITLMFEVPRLADLAAKIAGMDGVTLATTAPMVSGSDKIAIVGMSARLPQADTLEEFWAVMAEGRSVISRFDPSELADDATPEQRADPNYVPARSVLNDVDKFDAKFFGMMPLEAAQTDPQGRVFLEVCQHALDDAGLDPARFSGSVGVFAGGSMSTYFLENLMGTRADLRDFTSQFQIGNYTMLTGNDADSIATRVAYKLGLNGPAIAINTACSTSLVAISQAVACLRAGQSDAVLAGGVSITFPQERGYMHQEGGMGSADGQCRPFDAAASGTVFGHGAGVVVLKRLADAVEAGDRIYGVIEGVGLNNDGADKMSYTAPSVKGQADAIRMAHRDAGVTAGEIGYVECHGTATPLGDPIEISGLRAAFGDAPGDVALGSVKGNIGHLDAAAGVVSVIKTALMLHKGKVPPVAHFTALNPRIDLSGTPFRVADTLADWQGARRAGVSSFGVGGTNAHLVIGAAPAVEAADMGGPVTLPLSAKSPEALTQMAQEMAAAIEHSEIPLPKVARSLQDGRRVFAHRGAVGGSDRGELVKALRAMRGVKTSAPELVMMCPGQGSQYPGMGAGLYASDPVYKHWIDVGAETLRPLLDEDITRFLTGESLSDQDAARALRETRLTQPALVLVQYATAKMWAARGVVADRYLGHSVGEFTVAALTGILSFEDALRAIAARGQVMQDQAPGDMLSVRMALDDLKPYLGSVDLAASNAPNLQVVAGEPDAVAALAQTLTAKDIAVAELHTSHAFHSAMMDPVVPALEAAFADLTLCTPDRPVISAVTGQPLTDAQATDTEFWARQARQPVLFQAALQAVPTDNPVCLLELGAGRTLSAFAAQVLPRGSHHGIFQSLPDHARSVRDEDMVAATTGQIWAAGGSVDWSSLPGRGAQKCSLPGYAFQRSRHWIDPIEKRADGSVEPTVIPQQTVVPAPLVPPMTFAVSDPAMTVSTPPSAAPRLSRLQAELVEMLTEMSGEDLTMDDLAVPFLDLGFDSLFLGQVSQALSKRYKVSLTFRKMLSDYTSIDAVAAYMDEVMPAEAAPVAPAQAAAAAPAPTQIPAQTLPMAAPAGIPASAGLDAVMQAQMQTMQAVFAAQLQAVGGVSHTAIAPAAAPVAAPVATSGPTAAQPAVKTPDAAAKSEGFKTGRGVSVTGGTMTPAQVAFARDLAARYSDKHAKSKAYAQEHRAVLADPRTAAGFRQEWKELTFPIVADRSKGSSIWDIDGNRFVDLVNGFGQTAFGHSPDFVVEAVARQMEKGFPIGPQADLAGPVAQKFADVVGHERVTFCNTGSEAVMAAMRLARTVTAREKIVVFDHDYHGQFDEVLVRGKSRAGGNPDALPIAPGIPRSGLTNMVVLKYGDPSALDWVRENAEDVAAVIVEPVQSRHPEHRPEDFVRKMRDITRESGIALVIDEVVTGFRTSKTGMQGVWGIQGDMATYGKVVGGGMPIGVLAGDATWMDALDGGAWQFGDDSRPEAIPTFFAGTFVRHPLVLAAVDATLDYMEGAGDRLWSEMADKCAALAGKMSAAMIARGLPDLVETYSSWFVINVSEHDPRASLLYPLMRQQGVHVMDGFCGFLTTEHSDADIALVLTAFENALDALLSVGIMGDLQDASKITIAPNEDTTPVMAPLTESQREIWMTHQMGGDAAASFNECGVLDLKGALNEAAIQTALDGLLARHDALRARFSRDGSGFQVTPVAAVPVARVTLADAAALDALIAQEGRTPFALTEGAPIRFTLVTFGPEHHALVLTAHHIVADGWSFGVMLEDFAALYTAADEGRDADLADAPSFADFARMQAPQRAETRAFWAQTYRTLPTLPDLPTDQPRPALKTYNGATEFFEISPEALKAAKKLGASQGCTTFSTLFAAMQMLVGKLTGADDIVLGVPTAVQAELEDQDLVGHCVNFLPVRSAFAENASIASHLAQVKADVLAAFDHQDTTFGTLLRELDVPRTMNRVPLTNVEFNYERDSDVTGLPGLQAVFRPSAKTRVNFDLFFNMCEHNDGLRIDAHYNTDLFSKQTIQRWCSAFETVLIAMVDAPEAQISALSLWPDAPVVEVPVSDYDRTAMIQDLVTTSARTTPEAIALEDANGTITYGELDARSDAAAAMIQARVQGQGNRIAVCLSRGIDLVVALLAVLKSGHAYVPMDPSQPQGRLRTIAQTARIGAVIGDDAMPFLSAPKLDLADSVQGAVPNATKQTSEDAAYVIFTSGSTGTPKGVSVPHRAVVNFLTSMAAKPGMGPDDVLLSVTTAMFDIAVLELFLPLSVGAKCVIAPSAHVIGGFELVERLNKGDITMMQATPTLWDMVLTAGFEPKTGLKMLAGGEPLPSDLAARLMAGGAELWNMYGPTETTIWSSCAQMEPGAPVHVGGPIANTQLYVLDAGEQPVGSGQSGQLFIGGDGLAMGYFDQPDLTATAFRDVSVNGKSQRLYATGDLATWRTDGALTMLGRIDDQVKLRGFRIELGEIEAQLRACDGIAQAATKVEEKANGDKRLVGYLVAEHGATLDPAQVSEMLRASLPAYMIPQVWVMLTALPQTGNGKLDRKALPASDAGASVTALRKVDAPMGDTEAQIAAIWSEVLGEPDLSVTATVHEMGMDSLAVFRIAAKMLDAGLGLEAQHMLAHPSIRDLAAFHAGRGTVATPPTRPSLRAFRNGARRA